MKHVSVKIIPLLIVPILLGIIGLYSATVWTDDFDDGNLDGWNTGLLDCDLDNAFTG